MTHFNEVSRSTLGLYYCGNSEHRHVLVTALFESSVPLGTLHCSTERKVSLEHFSDFFFENSMFYSPLLFHVSNQTNLDLTALLHTEHTSFILSVTTMSSAECLLRWTEQKQAEDAPSRATFSRLECHTQCPLPSSTSLMCLGHQNKRKDSCCNYTESFTFHRVIEL